VQHQSANIVDQPPVENSLQNEETDPDPFDYNETVRNLASNLLSEFVETRIAVLKWCLMLQAKAPTKACDRMSLIRISVIAVSYASSFIDSNDV
jgi:hypothetical protein